MKRSLISTVVAIAAATTSISTLASDNAYYAGASIGQSTADVEETTDVVVTDDKDTAWKLFAGYEVNKNLTVEVAYHDLGAVTAEVTGTAVDVDINGFSLSARGKLPVNKSLDLFGRLGFAKLEGEATANGSTVKTDDSDLVFGLGVDYSVNDNFAVRAEWERFNTSDEFSVLSAGVTYQF